VFVTTDGTINAWRASTAESMDRAAIVKDYSDHGRDQISGLRFLPAFTGVAMSARQQVGNRLYVTDFLNRTIRVLDNQWRDVTVSVPFARPAKSPVDFSPYNIQLLDGRLYVAFAAIDTDAEEPASDVPAPGAGHIVVYDLDGHIVSEMADAGRLNSPWGLAIAPENFGPFGRALLVANFGDGTIAAFETSTGVFRDYIYQERRGRVLTSPDECRRNRPDGSRGCGPLPPRRGGGFLRPGSVGRSTASTSCCTRSCSARSFRTSR
jgi:uncharacterized protein (TIGR03118 family)